MSEKEILISLSDQNLLLKRNEEVLKKYPISSSKYGIGNKENSYKTPLGLHEICEKIGENLEKGAVLKGRIFTGEICKNLKRQISGENDVITSRILRLNGLEEQNQNTKSRFIYIHGTNEEDLIGEKASHGCIRMKNDDLIELFENVKLHTKVLIKR